jgi:hypothetical protein
VEHEGICVSSELGDGERHALGHQSGDKRHVARQAIELGYQDRTPLLPCHAQRCRELLPPIESVCSFASLDLGEQTASQQLV